MKIFLLGLSGSGKTTLGKELAASLGLRFVDLDGEIEKAEGMPIEVIFKTKKEDHFRKVESRQLRQWCLTETDFVMATGGGTPCFFDNMDLINQSGTSLFLDIPPTEIVQRILKTDLSHRPLFANLRPENVKDQIEFMRSQRLSFYRQAHWTSRGTPDSKDIIEFIKKESRP